MHSISDTFVSSKEGDIIIRIRRLAHTAELNLKQQRSNESDNQEYETDVADPEIVRAELFAELESLGLSRNDEETRGYDTLLYIAGHARA